MRAYEEYKDSGYDWLGKIPAHWDWHYLFQACSEQLIKNKNREDLPVLSLSYGKIIIKENINFGLTPKDYADYQIVNSGNIILRLTDLQNDHKSLRTGLVENKGIITSAYTCLKSIHNSRFIHYLLHSYDCQKVFYGMGGGVRQSIGYEQIKNLKLPIPPREEQDAIVRFLDAKCAKIDSLIKLKERQIELLNEKKQNIIDQAVTKGLDPHAPMKDSGVDWIGEIPEGWEVERCKYLFSETNFRSERGEETHLSMSQKYGLVPDSMLDERRMLSESYAGGKLCSKDDLVLNRLKAHLGVFALASQGGVISPDYTVLSINKEKLLPGYAEAILKSRPCRRELIIRVRGIVEGFWRLYTEDFNTIKLPLPPLEEQKKIMDFISESAVATKSKVTILERNIELIKEYRQRLISDAVTGKVNILEV